MAPRRSAAWTSTTLSPSLRRRSGPGIRITGKSSPPNCLDRDLLPERAQARLYFNAVAVGTGKDVRGFEAVPRHVGHDRLVPAPAPCPGELGEHADRDAAGRLGEDPLGPGQEADRVHD